MGRREILAFAAGIAVVVLGGRIAPILESDPVEAERAAGTLLSTSSQTGERLVVDTVSARSDRYSIDARTEDVGNLLLLRLEGSSEGPLAVSIDYSAAAWSMRRFDRSDTASSPTLNSEPGNLSFVQEGPGPFSLEMELQPRESSATPGRIELRLESGAIVESIELETEAGPAAGRR